MFPAAPRTLDGQQGDWGAIEPRHSPSNDTLDKPNIDCSFDADVEELRVGWRLRSPETRPTPCIVCRFRRFH